MKSLWMKSLTIFLAFLILGAICPFAKAETIIIDEDLSGDRIFRGFPIKNPEDGSTTYLGLSYRGDVIEGDLPGEWAVVMQATYPKKVSTGTILGLFSVGVREEGVFGVATGTIDFHPQAGEFSFDIAIAGGTGQYAVFIGFGDFTGTISDRGKYIDGNLTLILYSSDSEEFRGELEKENDGNPALLLLK